MTTEIIVPEDLKEMIGDILAQESLEIEEDNDENLERVYIEDLIPEIKDEEQRETWNIKITI